MYVKPTGVQNLFQICIQIVSDQPSSRRDKQSKIDTRFELNVGISIQIAKNKDEYNLKTVTLDPIKTVNNFPPNLTVHFPPFSKLKRYEYR